ncbi:MAG: sterol desaturase family protein [Lysobacter sp.]|nr:sterol desaturase family protein [Lysobacter sp.]
MNDTAAASAAPGLGSLGIGIEPFPRHGNPLLRIGAALWRRDIAFARHGWQRIALILCALGGVALWLLPQTIATDAASMFRAESVRIFYMVGDLSLSKLSESFAALLVAIAIGRAAFVIAIGVLDMATYRRIVGRPFDWESMINVSLVNAFFIFSGVFVLANDGLRSLLTHYDRLLAQVPTLIDLNGAVALIVAALIGDFCFYWSHRFFHGNRFFWNLGHIYHHRNRGLTQLTCAIEPPLLLLQAAGGLSLLLLPLLSKLFTTDIAGAGIALLVLMIADTWTDPSHSTFMYWLESKSRALKALRAVFVTVGVHFVHHSRDVHGPKGTGCNFGARLTVWDRLFGTYVEPQDAIPDSGLFDPHGDACVNPLRYLLLPYVRMGAELRRNKLRHWPEILFGPVGYEPPNPVVMSH